MQKIKFGVCDPCRRVQALLGRKSTKPSCGRKKQGEYGIVNDRSKNTTQFRKQSPHCAPWVIGEDVRLIKRDDDKWSPWSFDRIQHIEWVYKLAEPMPCLFNPLAISNVSGKYWSAFLIVSAASHELERYVNLRN